VVQTSFGVFDTVPQSGETIIPVSLENGPASIAVNLRMSRSFGIGPKLASANQSNAGGPPQGGGPGGPGGGAPGGPGGGGPGGGGGGGRGGMGALAAVEAVEAVEAVVEAVEAVPTQPAPVTNTRSTSVCRR